MTISDDLKANILRYHHVEKWRVGTIARQLNVHHTTVKRVLSETGVSKHSILVQASMIDPFLAFVTENLQRFPTLTASRLYDMVRERGYPGSRDHFRHMISFYRPRKAAEAYMRLRTLPGEQAQVDWGHFGHITIGKAKRPLMAFVMVLSYSRKIFLHFYLNQRTENFLRGHEAAFFSFGGVPRVLLYDNLKAAVLERMGDAIRFNPQLLDFAAHYRFEPRPVAVCRGNEKGRVERAIRYVRDNFFAAREYASLSDYEFDPKTLDNRLRSARLGRFKTLAEFDWAWPKQCDRGAIEQWMQLDFIKDATNPILSGPNGVWKSTIACNIAHQAILKGFTALFTTAAGMLNELAAIERIILMKIDYKKLFPAEIPDDVAYNLVDFFYNLATTFDGMHLVHVMRHESVIINGRIKPKRKQAKSSLGVTS